LRGLCVLLMIMDHFFYAAWGFLPGIWQSTGTVFWQGLSDFARNYWNWGFRQDFRIFIVVLFCTLCGISCVLSKSNLKRGLMAALVAGVITLATSMGERVTGLRMTIYFGVIHMYAGAILIYCALDALSLLIGGKEYRHKKKATFFKNLLGMAKTRINIESECLDINVDLSENDIELEMADEEDSAIVKIDNDGLFISATDGEDKVVIKNGSIRINANTSENITKTISKDVVETEVEAENVPQTRTSILREWAAKLFPSVVGLIFIALFFSLWGYIENGDVISTVDRVFDSNHTTNFVSMFVYLPRGAGLVSADYFPILPWAGFVFLGSAIGHVLYGTRLRGRLGGWIAGLFSERVRGVFGRIKLGLGKSVGLIGRKTLWIYVVHQPLFVGFFWLVGWMVG